MTPVKLTATELEAIFSKLERDQYITSANSLRGHLKWLQREADEARALVAEANNSLYGSQNYFHSLDGGPFNKLHLASGIENLKATARLTATLQREADGMREALGGISEHAENQDINHLDFRIHAKRCADQALEACSPQVEAEKGSDR